MKKLAFVLLLLSTPRMGGVDVEVHMGSHVNKLLSFVRTLFALSAIAGDLPNVYLTGDLAED